MKKLMNSFVCSLFVAVAVAADAAGNRSAMASSAVHVQILPDGKRMPTATPGAVVAWSERLIQPRTNAVWFLKIDLTDRRVEACVRVGAIPAGTPHGAEASLAMPEELMTRSPDTLALINANAFAAWPPSPPDDKKDDWRCGDLVDIEGLAASDGVMVSPDDAGRTAFWLDANRRPHLGHPLPSDTVREGVADWFAPLILNGRPVDGLDRNPPEYGRRVHPRSLLGFDETGRWLLLAVVDGRQAGYSLGMTLVEAAQLMLDKGCTEAINLDGGGSSILLVRDGHGSLQTLNRPSRGGKHRPVPVMIGVRRAASSPAEPVPLPENKAPPPP